MKRQSALYLAGAFLLAALVEPTWSWVLGRFLDQASQDPGWVVRNVSWALDFLRPYEPYFVGLAIGLALGLLLTRDKQARPKGNPQLELGERAVSKAALLGRWLEDPHVFDDFPRYLAEVHALVLDFRKLGFEVPNPPKNTDAATKLRIARHYFLVVGNLLTSGHTIEATSTAKNLTKELESASQTYFVRSP